MSKPRYKRGRRSTRFKNLADGLRIGVSQQEAATTRVTEQLKQTQREKAFESQNFISGFESTATAEWRNLKEIQQFKSDKRQHKVDAITTRNKTDLERLNQEIKLKQGEYEYWKDLSPKMAKAAKAFVEGGLRFGDMLHGMIEWEREDVQERIDNTALPQQKLNFTLSKENLDQKEKLSQNGYVELARTHDKSGLKLSSYWAQRKLFKLVRENKTLYKNLIIESWNKDNGETYKYQENNAMEVMDFGARALLNEFGISPTSSAGKELILEFRKIGLLDANHKADERKAGETSKAIEQSLDILETILANPNSTQSEKNLALNDLVWTIENGYYIKDGKVLNPNNAQQRLSKADSGITAFKYLADRNLPYFNSRAEYEEFFGNMVIPGEILEWTTDQDISAPGVVLPDWVGGVTWRTKLGPRYEKEVMGYIDKMLDNKVKANDLKRKTDGNIAYTQEQANKQKLIDNKVDVTSQEFLFKKWDEISRLPIDETSRENLYALYGYNHKDIQNLDLYKAFKTAESEGDEYQMVRLINGLGEGKAKKALQNSLRVHRQVTEYGGHKKLSKNISLIVGGDGTSDYEGSTILTPSGKDARDFFTARVIQALKNDPNLTVEKAIELEQKEFDKGSGLGASGIYKVARRPGNAKKGKYYYNFMGDNEKKYNMVNTYLISPVEAVLHAKDLGLDLGNPTIDDAQALKILHSTNYESWTIEDLNSLAQVFAVPGETEGKLDFGENEDALFNLLYDARFVAPKPVKTIADRIINKAELNIEKNFPELAKKVNWYSGVTGKSKKEIYDLLFKNYNIKDANDNFVSFPLQKSDVDNSSDTKDNNQEGSTLINEVKETTGKTPMRWNVDLQVNQGMSKEEAYFKHNNIAWQQPVDNEFVTDWESIINSDGISYVKDIDTDSLYNAFYGYQYDVNYTNLGNLTPDQVKARAKELGITPKEFKNRIRGSK